MNITKNKKLLVWIILLLLSITWGSSFLLIKRSLESFSYIQVGLLRVSIAFLVLLPWIFKDFLKITTKQWKYLFIVGLGNVLPAILFAKAQEGIDSSLAGIMNSITPLFALLIGLIFFKLKTKWYNITGMFIGLFGTAGLLSISGGQSYEFNFSYAIYIFIASFMYAVNLNIVKFFLEDLSSIKITTFAIFTIAIPSLVILLFFTDFINLMSVSPKAIEGLAYVSILAIFCSALAIIAFNYLIKMSSVLFSSSVTYIIPLVALLIGVNDGEKFEIIYIVWIAVIISGVFLVNHTRGKK